MNKRAWLSVCGALILVALTLGCGQDQSITSPSETPAAVPTETPAPPKRIDVPVYRNGFEDLTDPAAGGITSDLNEVRINTENVAYQSGSQALEAAGTIAGPAISSLTIDLSVQALTGQRTLDLSNKTLGFSFFIPANSPIDNIVIVARAGSRQVNLVSRGISAAEQGKWQYRQFDLKRVYDDNAWAWTDLSNDEARNLVQNCDGIMFAGMRVSAGDAAPTSFLIDDLNWIAAGDPQVYAVDPTVDSLRKYADQRGLKVGAVLWHTASADWYGDPWYLRTLAQEFNLTTVGGVSPPQDRPADVSAINYDYTYEDEKLAFAESHGMSLRGGTGGNFAGNPQWVLDLSYADAKAFVQRKVEQDVGHFKGKMFSWGVFNEVVDDDGRSLRNRQKKGLVDTPADANAQYGYHYSPFVDGNDTSVIEAGFITAHRVDPQAVLFLNEFNDEELGNQKAEYLYRLIVGMKDRGVPIDGAGFELHLIYPAFATMPDLEDLQGYLDRVDRNIKRYAAAGLMVEFSEVECQIRLDDLDLSTQAGQAERARRVQKQAEVLSGLMRLARENPNVTAITFWTVADKPGTSGFEYWLPGFTYTDAYLFDKNYEPKPAYFSALDVLKP